MRTAKHVAVGLFSVLCIAILGACKDHSEPSGFISQLPSGERVWLGPEFWANRWQDWTVSDQKIFCNHTGPNRNVSQLTHNLLDEEGAFSTSVNIEILDTDHCDTCWVGMRLGAEGRFGDYRDNAVYGQGYDFGVTMAGELKMGLNRLPLRGLDVTNRLKLTATSKRRGVLTVEISQGALAIKHHVKTDIKSGNFALVSHFGDKQRFGPTASFDTWEISGTRVGKKEAQKYGPLLFAQHTISKGILKMTAQLPIMGDQDGKVVHLQTKNEKDWQIIGTSVIDPLSKTANFKIGEWDDTRDHPYRLIYDFQRQGEQMAQDIFEGTIRRDPKGEGSLKMAAFTGNNDLGFPNTDLITNVTKHDPDFLFFSGDQIYEAVGGYGVQCAPLSKAAIDYLRKWAIFGWTFRDLMRDRPCVTIPDDHDVYHGNLWGAGGVATPSDLQGSEAQDQGGYKMPATWVNMVQRTQTSHLPDPYDPTPAEQNIGVYYTDLNYGGVSFAIIEDRKFKSAPTKLLPEARVWNGWAQNKNFDMAHDGDPDNAVLLGMRQEQFLSDWAHDWSGKAWMKVLLSQTIFANVATLPAAEMDDQNVPKLRILNIDEYAEGDRIVQDMDSNGWPHTPRNNALRIIRKSFAIHIAGDQHLGSTIQYGVDEYGDAPYALCVPSVSNVWPRRWYPPLPGGRHQSDLPKYTGDYEDGFGNKITVFAVSNPTFTGREPSNLYDRATGYGIIEFSKDTREITVANWARDTDPLPSDSKPYPGWPIIINQLDNYGRRPFVVLANCLVKGMAEPVYQLANKTTGELIYTIRPQTSDFSPWVFDIGSYTIRIGDPDIDRWKEFELEVTSEAHQPKTLRVDFR